MNKSDYIRRMKEHSESFEKLWQNIVFNTNEFIKERDNFNSQPLKSKFDENFAMNFSLSDEREIERFTDNLACSGAWIQDRLNGYTPSDKKSLTKKIRKVLGYTIP